MADYSGEERDAERKERRERRERKERTHGSRNRDDVVRSPDTEKLRKARTEFYGINETSSRGSGGRRVVKISGSTSRVSLASTKSASRHRYKSRRKHGSATDESQRRKKSSRSKDKREKISTEEYVYELDGERVKEIRTTYLDKEKPDSEDDSPNEEGTMSDIQEEPEKEDKVRIVYIKKDKPRSSRHESSRHGEKDRSKKKSMVEPESPPRLERSSSKHVPSSDSRNLRRSHSHAPRPRPQSYAESNASAPNKRSSMFAGLFGPQISHQPIKLTECIVCLADDIPSTKSAKLKCGHRMCQSCLKRNFKLSITDPQHMPPKCCTNDHIPLHHVDSLFDVSFKKTWNRKFQEYNTKNRIYCPTRRCGEWITPRNIHRDKDGKKYGLCTSCKTKVCFLCNGKWHGSRDCPNDEETKQILETAKKAGWQRCYDCRTLVELKEGCNHMTCHCKAEFCMICGSKWKTCNCPWFNYETVERDRLLHMQVPEDPFAPMLRPREIRIRNYDEEINDRRRQERADEIISRRLQGLGIHDRDRDDDYNGGIGDIMGIGNGAGHFMNESFIRRPTLGGGVNYLRDRRPPPTLERYNLFLPAMPSPQPPRLRGRDMIDRYPPPTPQHFREEIIEEISPGPSRHADRDRGSRTRVPSIAKIPERSRSLAVRERSAPDDSVGSSELAGLNTRGSGGGIGRVKAWRAHVEPGVPDEGVLSM